MLFIYNAQTNYICFVFVLIFEYLKIGHEWVNPLFLIIFLYFNVYDKNLCIPFQHAKTQKNHFSYFAL